MYSSVYPLKSGLDGIYNGMGEFNTGVGQLVSGIREINKGASQLSSGTNELNEQTNSMPDEVDKQINEMMAKYSGKDFEPVSFASEENTNVESVQFAMRTDGVSKVEDDAKETENVKEEKPSIWELFLALFKK